MKKVAKFFASVKEEMKMVRWPKKKEMFNYSVSTIAFIALFMGFFAIIDAILSFAVKVVG
jgi:preprotein translocase SecE subunit